MPTKLLLCDCGGSFQIDHQALAKATGWECSPAHSHLCTRQIAKVARFLDDPQSGPQSGPQTAPQSGLIIGCAQERDTFHHLAEERAQPAPLCLDLRDRAGWSDDTQATTPKIAALLATEHTRQRSTRTIEIESQGLCLIVGASAVVLPIARQLAATLSPSCLLSDMPEFFPNPVRDFDVALGRLEHVSGSFGRFEVTVADYRPLEPAGRGNLTFAPPQARAVSECDLILDLSGGPALFAPHQKRDGYLRADPGDPLALQRAAFDAAQMTGTFEKTLFVRTDASLCAHSRAQQQGCTRCLDACPTGAITPNGDAIAVDPRICAGCAGCSAVCPSGAVSFDAPGATEIFADIRKLGQIYRAAGGKAAHLLVHDDTYGREMISLAARFGRGLPAHVLPLELPALAAFGHAEIMVALASGFGAITLLLSPQTERGVIETEVRLATDIARHLDCAAAHIQIFDVHDPDALSAALYDTQTPVLAVKSVLPLGTRRAATRLAARAQAPENARATPIPLAPGAPYGNVRIDTDACTLCLACAALCPSGALSDNPDYPQLLFREDACLQCGLCTHVCPENALVLEPRLDLSDAALSGRVLKQEEPYHCIECGTAFGVKSTIERIVAKLEGQHAMFASGQQGRLIRMCSDCRVRAQYHENNAPFRMGDRPRVRTTDDYLDPSKKR